MIDRETLCRRLHALLALRGYGSDVEGMRSLDKDRLAD
jgi:hypothetical protein